MLINAEDRGSFIMCMGSIGQWQKTWRNSPLLSGLEGLVTHGAGYKGRFP